MQKPLSFVRLAALLAVTVLLCGTFAACDKVEKEDTLVSGVSSGEYEYTRSENTKTARISKYKGTADTLEIPQTLDNLPVVAVEKNTFADNATLKQVTLPESVEKIESGAFKNCTALTTVKLSDKLTEIGDYAFTGCTALTAVSLPDTVTTIGSNAFSGCAVLEKVIFGDNVQAVGMDAFYGTKWFASLTDEFVIVGDGVLIDYNGKSANVTVPKEVKHIASAFINDTSVQSVTLQDGITQVDNNAFQGCACLTTVKIPASVTSIGNYAFARCISLNGVELPDSVESIGTQAFSECIALRNFVVPKNVTTIAEKTFDGCKNLARVTFHTGVKDVQKDAFADCGGINVVAFDGKKAEWEKIVIAEGNDVLKNAILNCAE